MSKCRIFNNYQRLAEDISQKINESQSIDEKVQLAKELLNLEKELESCERADDPQCRLQRRIVVPARRKIAEIIFRISEAKEERSNE